jgi:pSer/pThr/pTyr-binding forkhead associated (FHA) protein
MARLVLKFDAAVLKEVPLGFEPVTIGRAPDNDIQIDNLAVSDHHARIFSDDGRPKVQDLGSLNGILLNGNSIKLEWLRSGDIIAIGKHVIMVDLSHDAKQSSEARAKVAAPKLDETVFLDTRKRSELGRQAEVGEDRQEPDSSRVRIPSLIVLKGKTNHKDYLLSGRLIVIGKSTMATVQLRGWFVPQAVAQISRRLDGYYLSPVSKRRTMINGRRITDATRLNESDVIEVGGASMKFMYRE